MNTAVSKDYLIKLFRIRIPSAMLSEIIVQISTGCLEMQPNFQYISRTRFNKIPVVITRWWHSEHADHVHLIDFT